MGRRRSHRLGLDIDNPRGRLRRRRLLLGRLLPPPPLQLATRLATKAQKLVCGLGGLLDLKGPTIIT